MNRALLFGIAIFFAVVGIALMGGENKVMAGHGCNGCACAGCAGCDCGGGAPACCGQVNDCCGCRGRRHHRHHRRNRCCGNPCCGPVECCGAAPACCGCGGAAPAEVTPPAPEAPAAPAASLKRGFGFRTVSFRN
ncbi:MAG TPA: hypothetical protein VMV10_04785 [Pirellulales bacterium]|nr:hypothetical protein [Pirellulales bacterium]